LENPRDLEFGAFARLPLPKTSKAVMLGKTMKTPADPPLGRSKGFSLIDLWLDLSLAGRSYRISH